MEGEANSPITQNSVGRRWGRLPNHIGELVCGTHFKEQVLGERKGKFLCNRFPSMSQLLYLRVAGHKGTTSQQPEHRKNFEKKKKGIRLTSKGSPKKKIDVYLKNKNILIGTKIKG